MHRKATNTATTKTKCTAEHRILRQGRRLLNNRIAERRILRKSRRKMSESNAQKLLLLRAPENLPTLRLFRRNVGMGIFDGRKVRFGIKGQCDLYAIVDGGRHIELECKSVDGRIKPESPQAHWRDWCFAHHVPWLCLTEGQCETPEQTVSRWIVEITAIPGSTPKP
jgi:hypothetical protein